MNYIERNKEERKGRRMDKRKQMKLKMERKNIRIWKGIET